MRGRVFLATVLLVCGAQLCCGPPKKAEPSVSVYDAETFFKNTSIRGASFSADETSLLVSSDASGVFNVYRQPLAGGDPQQLTHSTATAQVGVSWFPADDRFLFTADQGGNELNHLFVRQADGSDRDLTPGENLKAIFLGWSGDRKSFWVWTNERDPRFFDVYRYQTDDYRRELVFQNDQAWTGIFISPDSRWFVLGRVRSNADSDLYLWDASEPRRQPQHITPHEGNVVHGFMTFSPDSQKLYYRTNGHGEFVQAWSYDFKSGEHRPELVEDWDVSFLLFSETGKYRVSGINQDATTVVSVLDTGAGEPVALPQVSGGNPVSVRVSRSETKMALYINSDRSPSNLHVVDLESGQHRQLSHALNPEIDQAHLVEGRVVRYKSFDDLEIPAILYRPHGASADRKVPALVWVHGGPGGQSRKGYSALKQHLVNNGYALLAVNNRGSSGYGKTFHHMDDRKHGDVDLKDCVWARRYLESLDWVDAGRIGIGGGSYGGYMVGAALAFEPDVFDVGINIFGVMNWVRTLNSIPPWWTAQKDALYAELGDPKTEEERLTRISPLFHAANIRKPLLVVQGANDPRVLQVESDEIVAAVRANQIPVEYLLFPDEGHGFRSRDNRIRASQAYLKFLDRYLKGHAPTGDRQQDE